MPSRRRSNPESTETPEPKRAAIGGNVTKETLVRHFNEISMIETEMASARQALSQAWKDAEADGINKKAAKLAFKQMAQDPASADHFVRSFTHYTQQLGLFDKIDEWKQAEATEANAASVAAASKGNGLGAAEERALESSGPI